MKDRLGRSVTEADAMEGNGAGGGVKTDGIRRVHDVVGAIEHFETTLRAGRRAFHGPRRVGELLQGLIEHSEIDAEKYQRSERKRSVQDVKRSQIIHRRGPD